LEKPEGGTMVCTGSTYLKFCEFACDKGLEIFGEKKRQCQKNGFWSGKRATCNTKRCETLDDPLNGRVNCDGTAFGSSCTHRCNKGFTLKGTVRRFCGDDDKWTGKEVTCVATTCGEAVDPPHGNVKCNGDNYGSTCTYGCDEGYEVDGNMRLRRCRSNGHWSGGAVSCKPRDCGKLSSPPDGFMDCPKGTTMGNVCLFSCNPGYKLTDDASKERTCGNNGEWGGAFAECSPVDCGQPQTPAGAVANCALGTQLGSTCTLQCSEGFRVPGTGNLKCMKDGTWFGSMDCVRVECPEPPRPQHGTVNCAGTTLEKSCTFGCKKGWNLSGSPIRTCMQSGTWNGVQPKCVPASCAALLEPPGGTMKCRSAKAGAFSSTSIRYGASCDFSCSYGYHIEGSKSRSCKEDGSWSGSAAACTPIDCRPPAAIRGCEHKCEAGTTLGKECTIVAREAFTLVGGAKEEKIACTGRGDWTKTKAVCIPAKCPSLESSVDGFGKVTCSNKEYLESNCGLSCNNNLVRTGPRTKECLAGSTWSGGEFACKPLPSRTIEYGGLGDRAPVFTFFSTAGDLSLRLESLGVNPRSVYLELQNGKKGTFLKSWLVGMMNNFGLSICYGTATAMSSNVCPLKIDSEGVVYIKGAAYFHDEVKYVDVEQEKAPTVPRADNITNVTDSNHTKNISTGSSKDAKDQDKKEGTKDHDEEEHDKEHEDDKESSATKPPENEFEVADLGEPRGHNIELDARLDAEVNEGELSEAEINADKHKPNQVLWNGEEVVDALSLLQEVETSTQPEYHALVGGDGPQTPAAKWMTENGKVSVRLESQNSLEPKNVYLEMRNKGRRDAWGIGLRKDLNFYLGYGMLGTYGQGSKKNAIKIASSKDVTFMNDVVFSKMPSFFKEGAKLDLKEQGSTPSTFNAEPEYGERVNLKTKSALSVPDVPVVAEDALGATASAEPILAYHSKDNLSIRITAESTGSLKEAFMEFRSQKKRAWRLAVHSDGDMYITYHASASLKAGEKIIRITKKGDVHFYGAVSFGGKTLKKF